MKKGYKLNKKQLLKLIIELSAYVIMFVVNWKIAILIFLAHWAYNILRDVRAGKW